MTEWTCPTESDKTTALSDILNSDSAFFTWMQSSKRASCTTLTGSDVYKGMQQLARATSSNSSDIADKTQQVTTLTALLKTKMEDANIAKDRASMIVRPELLSSYYDGWFPLYRPLKHASIPILLFLASLMITAAFFMMLGIIGIHSHFFILMPDTPGSGTFGQPFRLLLLVTVLLFGLTIYAFMR